jgi:hypothetical protein
LISKSKKERGNLLAQHGVTKKVKRKPQWQRQGTRGAMAPAHAPPKKEISYGLPYKVIRSPKKIISKRLLIIYFLK